MQWLLLILTLPYIYLLLRIYINFLKIREYKSQFACNNFITVVVACRNESVNLPLLLKDISEQDYDPDSFEVIVVDDNSDDNTFEIASGFSLIRNIKVLKNNASGKKQALRTGIKASSSDFIVTTDADCSMGRRWLSTINSFYCSEKSDMIICPVKLTEGTGFFQKFQELEYLSLQGVTAGTALAGDPIMCNGANLAFTREAYNKNSDNLHNEILSGDDIFLLHNLKKDEAASIKWLESKEAVITTKSQTGLSSFLRQRARWISKTGTYRDRLTVWLGIATFVIILTEIFLAVAGILNNIFLPVLVAVFILKSVPDFLILNNTASRYGKKGLLAIFIPSQVIYPVYVISVVVCYLITRKSWSKNL